MPPPANIISLGSSLRLYSLTTILDAFAPAGLTRNGLLRLLKALNVPYLQVGATRYVHLLQFQIALYAVLRIGRRPFVAPGSPAKRKDRGMATRADPPDPAEWVDLVAELLYAKKLAAGLALTRSTIRRDALSIASVLAAQVPHSVTARALSEFTVAAHANDPTISRSARPTPNPLEGDPCPTRRTPAHRPCPPIRSTTHSTASSAPAGSRPPADSTSSTRRS